MRAATPLGCHDERIRCFKACFGWRWIHHNLDCLWFPGRVEPPAVSNDPASRELRLPVVAATNNVIEGSRELNFNAALRIQGSSAAYLIATHDIHVRVMPISSPWWLGAQWQHANG